jgi:hypothetical protein
MSYAQQVKRIKRRKADWRKKLNKTKDLLDELLREIGADVNDRPVKLLPHHHESLISAHNQIYKVLMRT